MDAATRRYQELEAIMAALAPEEWANPEIFSWDEESRIVHTLIVTQPGTNQLYYYEWDTGEFERLEIPGVG